VKRHVLLGGLIGAVLFTVFIGPTAALAVSSPSDNEIREAVQAAARLTDHHRSLKSVRGMYKQTIKWWRGPDTEPVEATSSSSSDWLMDMRFLRQELEGRWLEMPFRATLILGYDSAAEEYRVCWIDTLSTRMLVLNGKIDEGGNTVTFHGEYTDPTSKQMVKLRGKMQMPDRRGEATIEMYRTAPDGSEYKFLEASSERYVARGA